VVKTGIAMACPEGTYARIGTYNLKSISSSKVRFGC